MIPVQLAVTAQHHADACRPDPRRTAVALAVTEHVPAGVMAFDHCDGRISFKVGFCPHDWITSRLSDADVLALADQGPLLESGDSQVPVMVTVRVPEAHEVSVAASPPLTPEQETAIQAVMPPQA